MTHAESSPHPVITRRPETMTPDQSEPDTFAALIRQRTWDSHAEAEGEGFVHALFRGELTLADYVAMTTAHYFIYQALEALSVRVQQDPVASPLIHPGLNREAALAKDLESLLGPSWRGLITPSPATQRYCARVQRGAVVVDQCQTVISDGMRYVAHAYTRYLGDLSGGQMIRKRLVNHFGFIENDRVAFYEFPDLGPLGAFKNSYRESLNALPLSEVEQQAVIDEIVLAYRLNVELFDELEAQRISARP